MGPVSSPLFILCPSREAPRNSAHVLLWRSPMGSSSPHPSDKGAADDFAAFADLVCSSVSPGNPGLSLLDMLNSPRDL